jgi:hypothetical protein
VSGVSVRVKRITGTSALQVRLETSSGALVEQGSIPASSFPTSGYGGWATLAFASGRTLSVGQGYRLVLSAPADTQYSTFVIREGGAFQFDPRTYFSDGQGEYNPGTGWVGFDQPGGRTNLTLGDLQFYFR